jgi:adenosylcobinamide-GDP ribazoletransferase
LPHVGDVAGSKSKPLADQISGAALRTGLIWCVLALVLVAYGQVSINFVAIDVSDEGLLQALLNALMASLVAWAVMARWFWRRLGGFTGDCLGATQQVCEVAFYLGLGLSL